MIRRIVGVLLFICLASVAQAQTPSTRSALSAQNNANIKSNGTGAITGPILNSMIGNIIASMVTQSDANNPFNSPPIFVGLNGIVLANGSTPISTVVPGSGVLTALTNALNASGGLVGFSGSFGRPIQLDLGNASDLPCAALPALTGDVTSAAGSCALTVGSIGGQTITLAGGFSTSGAFSLTVTTTGDTSVTLPTSGTLATTDEVSSAVQAAIPSTTPGQILTSSGTAGVSSAITPGAGVSEALPYPVNAANGLTTYGGSFGRPTQIDLTNANNLPFSGMSGTLLAAQEPAHTGDVTNTAGSLALTIAANAVTSGKMAAGAAVANIGFTPLNPANNLSDLASKPTARVNLQLASVTPQDYGAAGNGTTDDSVAVSSWMNSGLPLTCRSGSFKLTTVVTGALTSGGGFAYRGPSAQQCNFVLSPASTVYGAFGATVTVSAAGSGYIVDDVLPCTGGTLASPVGVNCVVHVKTLSNQATATATLTSGSLSGLTVVSGGSGYSSTKPPGVYLSGGAQCGAKAHATVTSGAVSALTVTYAGAGACSTAMTVYIDPPPSGGIGTAEIWNGGAYSTAPTSPITLGTSQRGTAGTGATITVSFALAPAPAGLKITAPTPNFFTTPQVSIDGLTIVPANLIGNSPALEIDYAGTSGAPVPLVNLTNFNVIPSTNVAASLECLHLQNAAVSNFSNGLCESSYNYATAPGLKGIYLSGLGSSTTGIDFANWNVYQADVGYYFTGTVLQGVRGQNLQASPCNIGVQIAPSDNNFIEGIFRNLDLDCSQRGFLAENAPNVIVSDSIINQEGTPRYGGISACIEFRGEKGVQLNDNAHDNQCSNWQAIGSSVTPYATGLFATNNYGSADNAVFVFHDNQIFGGGIGLTAVNSTDLDIHDNIVMNAYSTFATAFFMQGGNTGWIGPNQSISATYGLYNDANSSMQQPAARINSATTGNLNAP